MFWYYKPWFLHFMTTFWNFFLKVYTSWSARVFKPFLETRNVSDVCEYVWSTFPEITWFLDPHKSLILVLFNLQRVLKSRSHDTGGYLYPYNTHIFGKRHNILRQINQFAWSYGVFPLNDFLAQKVTTSDKCFFLSAFWLPDPQPCAIIEGTAYSLTHPMLITVTYLFLIWMTPGPF